MPVNRFAGRCQKLLKAVKQTKAEAILVTGVNNVRYLTGFSGDSSYLLLSKDVKLLLSDTRYTVQISEECPDLEVYIRDSKEAMTTSLTNVLKKAKLKNLAFEGNVLTVAEYNSLTETLREALPAMDFLTVSGLVEKLREIKDTDEINEIRHAVQLAERGFACLRAQLRGEQTELEVAHNLEHDMRRFGATRAGFAPIVAVGPQAALPHATPGCHRIEDNPILLIDWGAETPSNYRSDLTRVLVTGKSSAKLEKIYNTVLAAQRVGIAAIKPGAKCSDVDAAARKVIEDAGFGKNFGHGLGHSIGMDIHEWPRFSALTDDELKPGMVMTAEPGIYLAGWGGVRIEDDVLVTKDGHEVLSNVPKEFDEMHVNLL